MVKDSDHLSKISTIKFLHYTVACKIIPHDQGLKCHMMLVLPPDDTKVVY